MVKLRSARALTIAFAGLVIAAGTAAQAASVGYYTTGVFGSPSTGDTTSITFAGNTYSVKFTGEGSAGTPTTVNAPTNSNFGSFQTTATSTTPVTFTSVPFTLSIFQTTPGTGSGTLIGALNGLLSSNSSGLAISFILPTTTITSTDGSSTTYTSFGALLNPPNSGTPTPGMTTLVGGIGAPAGGGVVPLPPAVLSGAALLGSIGLTRMRRLISA